MEFVEIRVSDPKTQGIGSKKHTDYEIKTKVCWFVGKLYGKILCLTWILKTNCKAFKLKESSVRRRFSEFEWLKKELENCSKVIGQPNRVLFVWIFLVSEFWKKMLVPSLPEAPWSRHLPSLLRKDEGLFDETFIEDRRKGLEDFINK